MTLHTSRARTRGFHIATALIALTALLLPAGAHAGGYDTPMLYSARHMGMGGAAVGYVGDASALFHNPAGLGQIGRFHLIADLSLLIGQVQASPVEGDSARNVTTERGIGPAFLLGAGFRVAHYLTLGIGVFPVAAAGGEYLYNRPSDERAVRDSTTINFFELTPTVAVNIDQIGLRIGISHRYTYLQFERDRGTNPESGAPRPDLLIKGDGASFLGFRLGAQYQPPQHPNLQLGINYRSKTSTEVVSEGDIYALGLPFRDQTVRATFVLPSRIEMGARYDFGTANENGHYAGGVAFDFIYAFNSENRATSLSLAGIEQTQVFNWSDAITTRLGGEYRVFDRRIPLRLGWSFDARTTNPQFPSAFGTPPTSTHIFTLGGGYDAGPWELNVAYAHRRGDVEVTQANIMAGSMIAECDFCGAPGDYEIKLNGIYLDFSYDWE